MNKDKTYSSTLPPLPPSPMVPISIGVAIALLGMATFRWLNGEDFSLLPYIHKISSDTDSPCMDACFSETTNQSHLFTDPNITQEEHPIILHLKELTQAIQKMTHVHEKFLKVSSDAAGKAVTDDVMGLLKKKSESSSPTNLFPYQWFLVRQLLQVKTHLNSMKISLETMGDNHGFLPSDSSKDSDNSYNQQLRDVIHKVDSISNTMAQLERVLSGQEVPKTNVIDNSC